VDVVTPDIGRPLAEAGGTIIEVNGTPGFQYHYQVADRAGATRVAIPILERVLETVGAATNAT
jgi:D-alanine-D-alanine ligase-like ATP-grasp enzyme